MIYFPVHRIINSSIRAEKQGHWTAKRQIFRETVVYKVPEDVRDRGGYVGAFFTLKFKETTGNERKGL